ncbi:MAG: cytochrome c peroxidase [Bacteroidales bacterium]|nr:cytochrome c peroxidase [Bacteroidales bacterium]MDZ4204156.1 cytochrome c peroxidase [Bacteroidales bacterium]
MAARRIFLVLFSALVFTLLLLLTSCPQQKLDDYIPTPYEIEIPRFFPTKLNVPADNPMTVEGIELGRYLFYDGRLSGRTHKDSLMSCGTCHIQSRGFVCGIDHPKFTGGKTFGLTGIPTPHNMMPLINLVFNHNGYLWNGFIHPDNLHPAKRKLEDLVWMGVTAPHEMAGDTNRTVALFQGIPGYPELFGRAFGSKKVTMKNIGRAIAQFARTLISSNSKFDRYLRGEHQLSEVELSGYVLFMTEEGADCFHCHGGGGNPMFTTNLFYNNGKDIIFNDPRDRYAITGDLNDIGAYRAPTLRNIEVTAPYMHDGRFATLEEVIDFYSHQVKQSPYVHPLMHHVSRGGVQLIPIEKSHLIAFIKTLRDDDFLTNPAFSTPAVFPDGSTQNLMPTWVSVPTVQGF